MMSVTMSLLVDEDPKNEFADKALKPQVLASKIVTRIDHQHAFLINRNKLGSMALPGESLFVLEMQPASYAILATNDVHFGTEDMYEAHDALLCIANSTHVDAADRPRSSAPKMAERARRSSRSIRSSSSASPRRCRTRDALGLTWMPAPTSLTAAAPLWHAFVREERRERDARDLARIDNRHGEHAREIAD